MADTDKDKELLNRYGEQEAAERARETGEIPVSQVISAKLTDFEIFLMARQRRPELYDPNEEEKARLEFGLLISNQRGNIDNLAANIRDNLEKKAQKFRLSLNPPQETPPGEKPA